MSRIPRNPYLAFPLGAVVGMALLVVCSLLLSDRLAANNAFAVFLLLLPAGAALYCSFNHGARASGGPWLLKWLGTAFLSVLASLVVLLASLTFVPFKARAEYNYPHFNSATYPHQGNGLVRAGGQAPDGTVYTLDGNEVRLADLWNDRPIVLEVGSIT